MLALKDKWKVGEIISKSEKDAMIQSFTSTIISNNDNSWRAWYSIYSIKTKRYGFGYMDGKLGNIFKRTEMNISEKKASSRVNIIGVPQHWRLIQPVYILLPDGKERIYFWAHA